MRILLHFHYLGYKNVRQLIFVEVIQLVQTVCQQAGFSIPKIPRDSWLAVACMAHDALVFVAHAVTCGMMWHDSHWVQIN